MKSVYNPLNGYGVAHILLLSFITINMIARMQHVLSLCLFLSTLIYGQTLPPTPPLPSPIISGFTNQDLDHC